MTWGPIKLRKGGGISFVGESDPAPGGGSQPGISVVDYLFTEVATAGVYTAPTLDLPENSYIIDVQWWLTGNGAQWVADTVTLDVADSAIGTIVGGHDVKSDNAAYSPYSAAQIVASSEPYIYPVLANAADPPEGGTITTTITTTIVAPPVVPSPDPLLVRLVYITPPTPKPAVFA